MKKLHLSFVLLGILLTLPTSGFCVITYGTFYCGKAEWCNSPNDCCEPCWRICSKEEVRELKRQVRRSGDQYGCWNGAGLRICTDEDIRILEKTKSDILMKKLEVEKKREEEAAEVRKKATEAAEAQRRLEQYQEEQKEKMYKERAKRDAEESERRKQEQEESQKKIEEARIRSERDQGEREAARIREDKQRQAERETTVAKKSSSIQPINKSGMTSDSLAEELKGLDNLRYGVFGVKWGAAPTSEFIKINRGKGVYTRAGSDVEYIFSPLNQFCWASKNITSEEVSSLVKQLTNKYGKPNVDRSAISAWGTIYSWKFSKWVDFDFGGEIHPTDVSLTVNTGGSEIRRNLVIMNDKILKWGVLKNLSPSELNRLRSIIRENNQ